MPMNNDTPPTVRNMTARRAVPGDRTQDWRADEITGIAERHDQRDGFRRPHRAAGRADEDGYDVGKPDADERKAQDRDRIVSGCRASRIFAAVEHGRAWQVDR